MVKIQKLEKDEVQQICEVDRQAFINSPFGELSGLKGAPPEERKDWQSVKDFGAYCSEHPDRVLVAIEGGKIVGFATLEYWPEKQSGKVMNSAVLPAYRGGGIGTALIQRLIKELRSLGARRIEVQTSHVPAACRMYEKAGFKLVKRDRKQTNDRREYDDSSYEVTFGNETQPSH